MARDRSLRSSSRARVLYLIAPIVVVRHLIGRSVVDRETFLGVIAAYLLIGMFFAFVYRVVGVVEPDPFFGAGGEANPAQALFFSFTTYSTTGYGNLVPAGSPGQTLAVAEMIVGQLFLITALGKVVSVWSPIGKTRTRRPRPGDGPAAVLAIAVGQRLPEGRQLRPDARELLQTPRSVVPRRRGSSSGSG